jgi:hypothetical protein
MTKKTLTISLVHQKTTNSFTIKKQPEMYELPSGMLLKIPSEAVHENIDLSVTPMDSVPTAESQIFLTDSGKLKSMAYPCLISAYLGKATTEYKHFAPNMNSGTLDLNDSFQA